MPKELFQHMNEIDMNMSMKTYPTGIGPFDIEEIITLVNKLHKKYPENDDIINLSLLLRGKKPVPIMQFKPRLI